MVLGHRTTLRDGAFGGRGEIARNIACLGRKADEDIGEKLKGRDLPVVSGDRDEY